MRLVLRNGFAHPAETFKSDDDLDALIDAAEQRSVIVQGVRCVRMAAGRLLIEFHGARPTLEAMMDTGWLLSGENMLLPTVKPRDGANGAVVVKGFAYGDYEIEEDAAAA